MVFKEAFARHRTAVEKTADTLLPTIEQGGRILAQTLKNGKKILICGNGGSAADAQHFAAELVGRYTTERPPFRAQALTTDTSTLTALANDYGYEDVFRRQVEALGDPGDALVLISTSGKSPNIVAAAEQARKQDMRTVLLTGEKGQNTQYPVDCKITVPSAETARVQEVHQIIYHSWCEYLDTIWTRT